jgi:AcrR family transcriptional regulator
MAKEPTSRATGGAWQWQRTAQTQRALLDAAREIFTEQGFTEASIADVVERAGSSVGSLYHHFGGKSELFLALYQEHQFAHEEAAREAVAAAKQAGETDATELFCAGARAFLDGTWQRRDLALLFFAGDGPPGFEVIKRRRGREWIGQNDALLRLPETALDRLFAAILTSLIGEGAHEVAMAKTRRQANRIIDAVIEYSRRLMTGGAWKPEAAAVTGAAAARPGASRPTAARAPRRTAAAPAPAAPAPAAPAPAGSEPG